LLLRSLCLVFPATIVIRVVLQELLCDKKGPQMAGPVLLPGRTLDLCYPSVNSANWRAGNADVAQ
jgi:hypothetical protein